MSRIIVKNIPTTADRHFLEQKFKPLGDITDISIRFKGTRSRRFAFVGFKHEDMAKKAVAYFNNTYFLTSKVTVELASTLSSEPAVEEAKEEAQPPKTDLFEAAKELVLNKARNSWRDILQAKSREQEGEAKHTPAEVPRQTKMTNTKLRLLARQRKLKKLQEKSNNKLLRWVDKPLELNSSRVYVTNLPYSITEAEVKSYFQQFGRVVSLKLPKESEQQSKGFAFVEYGIEEEAIRAFAETNNKVVFGRILHVQPALQDVGKRISQRKEQYYQENVVAHMSDLEKSSFKKKKQDQIMSRLEDSTNWNTLFLNPNTVVEYVARNAGLTKEQALSPDTEGLAVKIALAEADIIGETKQWLAASGVSLEFLKAKRSDCKRSQTTILVKNLPFNIAEPKLRSIFSLYGQVERTLLAPNRSIAVVEFADQQHAANAFKAMAYKKTLGTVLYLEWAPSGILTPAEKKAIAEAQAKEAQVQQGLSKILYVKNINFQTSEDSLRSFFQQLNPRSCKVVRTKEGKSMGYAFIQFADAAAVQKAVRSHHGRLLDGHALQLSVSKPRERVEVKQQKQADHQIELSTKLMVRNIPFQANKKELREMFKQHGEVKSVRLPSKADGTHRGFGFVEFTSGSEAQNAKEALEGSHLYGRRIVIEYAQANNLESRL